MDSVTELTVPALEAHFRDMQKYEKVKWKRICKEHHLNSRGQSVDTLVQILVSFHKDKAVGVLTCCMCPEHCDVLGGLNGVIRRRRKIENGAGAGGANPPGAETTWRKTKNVAKGAVKVGCAVVGVATAKAVGAAYGAAAAGSAASFELAGVVLYNMSQLKGDEKHYSDTMGTYLTCFCTAMGTGTVLAIAALWQSGHLVETVGQHWGGGGQQ